MRGTAQKIQSTEAFIEKLIAENEALKDQVEVLKRPYGVPIAYPREWRLTRHESLILDILTARAMATYEMVMTYAYSDKVDQPEPKIVSVFVCKLRKKLGQFGIQINTVWGVGYELEPASRARLIEFQRSVEKFTAGTAGFSEEAR